MPSYILSEKCMSAAGEKLHKFVQNKFPEKIITVENQKVAKVAVTVDGTWQRRGHNSKMGVVFVIYVDTGEILDVEMKSLTCNQCSINSAKLGTNSTEFKEWFQSHKASCSINHTKSSAAMESAGASDIFKRSIEKHCLMYSTFVGDGDSDCMPLLKNLADMTWKKKNVLVTSGSG